MLESSLTSPSHTFHQGKIQQQQIAELRKSIEAMDERLSQVGWRSSGDLCGFQLELAFWMEEVSSFQLLRLH